MTREEQIKHEAGALQDFAIAHGAPWEEYHKGFIEGAEWADANPIPSNLDIPKIIRKQGLSVEKHNAQFDECVAKVPPETMKEVSDDVDFEKEIEAASRRFPEVSFAKLSRIAKRFYGLGKAEALKDLPRWKKTSTRGTFVDASNILFHDGYYLGIKNLEKLPGFKGD